MGDRRARIFGAGAASPALRPSAKGGVVDHALDHRRLYRLPWSLPDNAVAWLEPTAKCNLACDGCYRANVDQHKSLDEIAADLDVFARYRTADGVSIAGGDPLTHPRIVDIVRMVAERGWKPILNTNGLALEEDLLRDLKRAGLGGFTFHIDSKQHRPKWKAKTEQDLNALRLHYAEMVARVGDLSCAFNATVYQDTLDAVPDLVAWAHEHIDIVHVLVFICYRAAVLEGEFDYYRGGTKLDVAPLAYAYPMVDQRIDISAPEVVSKIRERFPEFAPCAYLNGTETPDSFKWLLAGRLGTRKRIYGYIGPKMIELAQTAHHLWTGRYLAYASPAALRRGKSMLWLWPFDAGLRKVCARAQLDPHLAFRRLHFQSVMIIQPIDLLPDGRQNMCDGCPDMTVWNHRLAWSCRLEECLNFGEFVRTVRRERALPVIEPLTASEAAPHAPGAGAAGGVRGS
ncbi:MAG: radical SAM protein [Gemmatimonadetes bacterium]|nr:radical SAM protein [Gemmatimonadota bacterium]